MVQFSDAGNIEHISATSGLKNYSFEIGPIRPPSEGGSSSLLLRVTKNCPWNRCAFCYGNHYNHERFELRPMAVVKADINAAKALSEEIKALSWKLGYGGQLVPLGSVIQSIVLYGRNMRNLADNELMNFYSVINVFNWLCSGGRTVFLQDADTLVMHTDQLVEVIRYLKETLPGIERITSYARSKTIVHKKPEELRQLHEAGLSRLHVGLETGDDELLRYVDKGVTSEEHILAGKKAMTAGFELSVYVMPGLGGQSRWIEHARNTARVLNEINPHFIRSRPFVPRPNTPMLEAYQRGEFVLTSPHERLREIKLMVEDLQVTSRVCFDHNLNPSYWSGNQLVPLLKQDYDGYKFPEEKGVVLELINHGLEIEEGAFLHPVDMMALPHL